MSIPQFFNGTKLFIGKHLPEIYIGMGIGLSALTAVMAVKGSQKSDEFIYKAEYNGELSNKDRTIIYLKSYWPAALSFAGSVFFITSGQHIQYKRTAVATAACLIAQDSAHSFTEHVIDEIGAKRVSKIKDDITTDRFSKVTFDDEDIIHTGNGDMLCYDMIGGRPFTSSPEAIRRAESEMNKKMNSGENFISVNDFYYELDLDPIKFGDEIGWEVALEGNVDIKFTSTLYKGTRPCLVIDSELNPRWRLYA